MSLDHAIARAIAEAVADVREWMDHYSVFLSDEIKSGAHVGAAKKGGGSQ